jgi:hypothetical protein
VVLLVIASLTNVVGYQTVQSSNQQIINEEVNQRELLFQTIVDIANNKEIQRIILKSQIGRGNFFNPDGRFPAFDNPVLTKNQLKQMYLIGLILSKVVSKSKMQSMFRQYQLINPQMQKEISTVIEKDSTVKSEITQLSNSKCDCENENTITRNFTVICNILYYIQFPIIFLSYLFFRFPLISIITDIIMITFMRTVLRLNCEWAYIPTP